MTITVHTDLAQGTQEWLQARCGLLTASQMKLVLTPARLKPADNDKARAHLYELTLIHVRPGAGQLIRVRQPVAIRGERRESRIANDLGIES